MHERERKEQSRAWVRRKQYPDRQLGGGTGGGDGSDTLSLDR